MLPVHTGKRLEDIYEKIYNWLTSLVRTNLETLVEYGEMTESIRVIYVSALDRIDKK